MANRNRKQMSQDVFRRLRNRVEEQGVLLENADKNRWIQKLSDEDAALMAGARIISTKNITRKIRAVHLEHESIQYISLLGLPPIENPPDGLIWRDLTPGLFAITVIESDAHSNATAYEIKDIIEYSHEGQAYEGSNLEEIAKLFPLVQVFQTNPNFEYTSDLIRTIGSLISYSYIDGPINLDDETLAEIRQLFEQGSEFIPFENVLQGVLSISFGGLFLELYRAVEQLYSIPKLLELTDTWNTSKSISELTEILENKLGWRPKENEALLGLVDQCEQKIKMDLGAAFCEHRSSQTEPDKIATDIYKLRNSLVHFRRALGTNFFSDTEWNEKVRAMLPFVQQVYKKHGDRYHVPRSSETVHINEEGPGISKKTHIEQDLNADPAVSYSAFQRIILWLGRRAGMNFQKC